MTGTRSAWWLAAACGVLAGAACWESTSYVEWYGDGGEASPPVDAGPERCTAEDLTAALGAASPGGAVRIGACRIVGSFTVPSGVTLFGRGAASVLVTSGGRPALRLTPGTTATRLRDLRIESSGNSGLLIRGSGAAVVERVEVVASRGMAVGVQDVGSLALTDVTLTGPVTVDNQYEVLPGTTGLPDPDEWPTRGLVVVRAASLELREVTARGFAGAGATVVEAATTWRGGGVPGNLRAGMVLHGGRATLEDLEVTGTLSGTLLYPSYGGMFTGGLALATNGLRVRDGADYGLLHHEVSARHVDLVASGNGDAALWVQACEGFELSGSGTRLTGNHLAGVLLAEPGPVTIADARIEGTVLSPRIYGETGRIDIGDGIQLRNPTAPVTMRDLELVGNERVGLVIDLGGGSMDGVVLERIVVDGAGEQYGALAQAGVIPGDWDAGVQRRGATLANDAAIGAPLRLVPVTSWPAETEGDVLAREGLAAILDPDPAS